MSELSHRLWLIVMTESSKKHKGRTCWKERISLWHWWPHLCGGISISSHSSLSQKWINFVSLNRKWITHLLNVLILFDQIAIFAASVFMIHSIIHNNHFTTNLFTVLTKCQFGLLTIQLINPDSNFMGNSLASRQWYYCE